MPAAARSKSDQFVSNFIFNKIELISLLTSIAVNCTLTEIGQTFLFTINHLFAHSEMVSRVQLNIGYLFIHI